MRAYEVSKDGEVTTIVEESTSCPGLDEFAVKMRRRDPTETCSKEFQYLVPGWQRRYALGVTFWSQSGSEAKFYLNYITDVTLLCIDPYQ